MRFSKTDIPGNTEVTAKMPADHTQHNLQITVLDAAGDRAVPVAGSLKIEIRMPTAAAFEEHASSPVDLTSADNWLPFLGNTVAEEFKYTVSSLDADHTVQIVAASHKSGRGL